MVKSVFTIFLLIAVLTVAACTSGGEVSGPSARDSFIGGTKGLQLSFVENAPPPEVFDGGVFPFNIIVTAENVGEHTIPHNELMVRVSGIFPGDFLEGTNPGAELVLKNDKVPDDPFSGVQKDPDGNRIQGRLDQFVFPKTKTKMFSFHQSLAGNQEFVVKGSACYNYQTQALTTICLRSDLIEKEGGVCQIAGSKPVANSGAPVQVTAVTESIGGSDKILLSFKVRKVGSSTVFSKFSAADKDEDKCKFDFSTQDRVHVDVQPGTSLNAGTSCVGLISGSGDTKRSGSLLLSNGEGSFTCTLSLGAGNQVDALKDVKVVLGYAVLDSISKSIVVKHQLGTSPPPRNDQLDDQGTDGAACTTDADCPQGQRCLGGLACGSVPN